MEKRLIRIEMKTLSLLILLVWTIGCAPAAFRQGREYLQNERYPQAIVELERAVKEDPDNAKIHRDLGIAYYKTRQYQKALEKLKTAKVERKKDSRVILYLGQTYEQLEMYDQAIDEYLYHVELPFYSKTKRLLERRIELLEHQAVDKWARTRIEDERVNVEKLLAEIPINSVSVDYFKPHPIDKVLEEYEPFHIGLTYLLINDLSRIKGLIVINRIKLEKVYEELKLAATDLVDEEKAVRLDRLLGANVIITGTFIAPEKNGSWYVKPTLGMVKLNDTKELKEIDGTLNDFISVEKKLALEILDNLVATLSISLTPEERKRIESEIRQNIPTNSLEAFLAFSRGLDFQDQGMYEQAEVEFQRAISIDPKFDEAKEQLNTTQLLSQAAQKNPPSQPGEPPPPPPIDDFEKEWVDTLTAEKLRDEVLTTTVTTVSQTTTKDGGPPPKPKVEIRTVKIRW